MNICRMLDLNGDFFSNKKAKLSVNEYPFIRNKNFGHGFVFDDGIKDVADDLERLSTGIFSPASMLSDEFQIVLVIEVSDGQARGIKFRTDNNREAWWCMADVAEFKPDNIYAMRGVNDYTRLSPFIIVTMQRDYYLFKDITDRMTGRTTYNQLFTTGSTSRNWSDFSADISNDGVRRKSANGTIRNVYDNNFKKYIDIGIKENIQRFLTKNRASVCGTVWGHGGVGKTATVQSICDDLSQDKNRRFDYIVFASAKDRAYRHTTGEIADIEERIDSYRSLVECINSTIGVQDTNNEQEIVDFEGKLLIIIDDYETFPQTEKDKIEELIKKLNVNNHKVLITTRAHVIIGEEFATHEFNQTETVRFLAEVMQSEFPNTQISGANALELPDVQGRVFDVTSGRPLFIFQFAHVWVQVGNLTDALANDIRNREEAIEFLFGRIFKYLKSEGQIIFRAIGHLVRPPNLNNLVGKLRYIVNMESDEDRFDRGLDDLVQLRVIEVFENDFFRVYSEEIWKIMQKQYNDAPSQWRGWINQRLIQVTGNPALDTEQALLRNADAARSEGRSPKEVSDLYRQILNRPKSSGEIKSQAVRNLADYLFNNRGDKDGAVGVFEEYWEQFKTDPLVAKMYANYCWSLKKKKKAINVLMNFINQTRDPEIGFLGLCLTFRSILLIERKEDLKASYNLGDIRPREFQKANREIVKDLKELYNGLGNLVFQKVKASNLEKLNSGDKHNIATGLYQFSGICVRLHNFEKAIDICDFLLENTAFRAHIPNGCEKRREYAYQNLQWKKPLRLEKLATRVQIRIVLWPKLSAK